MASEDSQRFGGLPEVHRLRDLRDLDETWHREVPAAIHELDDFDELGEVVSLRRSQWVLLKEWDNRVAQVPESRDAVSIQIFPVVVVPTIDGNSSATEELDHLLQDIPTRCTLYDREGRLDLPAEDHRTVPDDGAAEAAFSIDESHQPTYGGEPFLLVFRTPHIVTAAHGQTLRRGCDS